jgi:nucleotide-binding universal stress UspA family protein
MTRVLVATDLSEASDEAILHGHRLAGADGSLTVIYVLPRVATTGMDPLFPQEALRATLAVPDLESRAAQSMRTRVAALTQRAQPEVLVRVGVPADEIVASAEALDASVIVVGSHGRTGLARMMLGSTAERVARAASRNVFVARKPLPGEQPAIVLATDLSDASEAAFDAAVEEAKRRSARLVAVHVIADPHVAAYSELAAAFGATSLGPPPELEREVSDSLNQILARKLDGSNVIGEVVVANGEPARTIVGIAEGMGAELIAIGSGDRTRFERLALGSVAEKVVRHAHCSVLVTHTPKPHPAPH